jgi:hypothetical protein
MSSLRDGITWKATTSLAPARVREVRFYVDGHRWWVDRTPPYTYGPEGAELPLRFISSVAERRGSVAFGVRVIPTDGRRGRTVSHAHTPESHLARNAPGNFGRHGRYAYLGDWGFGRLSAGDLANPPQGDLFSSYTGWLTFVGAGLFMGSGGGKDQFAWEMASDGKRIHLGTPDLPRRGGRACELLWLQDAQSNALRAGCASCDVCLVSQTRPSVCSELSRPLSRAAAAGRAL